MIGRTHPRFWKHLNALSPAVQELAREKYALWKENPHHPSLKFEERRIRMCVGRIGEPLPRDRRSRRRRDRLVLDWHKDYNRFRF